MLKLSNFNLVFKNQDKITSKYFVLWYVENSYQYNRLGITVSKKFSKKSVSRNRIKRVIRESFRLNFQHSNHSYDLVLMPKRFAYNQENKKLFLDLSSLWEKLKAL